MRRGFTLIEVMMAGAILCAGGTAIVGTYVTLTRMSEHQRRLTAAEHVTRGKLEELVAAHDPKSPAMPKPVVVDHFGRPTGIAPTSTLGADNYRVDWAFQDDEPVVNFMKVTVTATWLESTGTKTMRLATVRKQ